MEIDYQSVPEMAKTLQKEMRLDTLMENVLLLSADDLKRKPSMSLGVLDDKPQVFNTTWTVALRVKSARTGKTLLPAAQRRLEAQFEKQFTRNLPEPLFPGGTKFPQEHIEKGLKEDGIKGNLFVFTPFFLCKASASTRLTPCRFAASSTTIGGANLSSFSQGSTIVTGCRSVDQVLWIVNQYVKFISKIKETGTNKPQFIVDRVMYCLLNVVNSSSFKNRLDLTMLGKSFRYNPKNFPAADTYEFDSRVKFTVFGAGTYNICGNVSREEAHVIAQKAYDHIKACNAFIDEDTVLVDTHSMRSQQQKMKNIVTITVKETKTAHDTLTAYKANAKKRNDAVQQRLLNPKTQ